MAQAKTADLQEKSGPRQEYETGKRLLENGNLGQAALSLHNALIGFEESKDQNGMANAANQLGHLCFEKKEYETALQHYQRALVICDAANDRMSVLAVLSRRVEVYVKLQDYDKAVKDCLEILNLHQDNRDPQGAVDILERMAEIYIEAGESNKAADSYRTIAGIHKSYGHDKIALSFIEKAKEIEG